MAKGQNQVVFFMGEASKALRVRSLTDRQFHGHFGLNCNFVALLCDKTFAKWRNLVLTAIYSLEVIDFDNRFNSDNGSLCKISVDGTNFQIQEPTPFNRKWFSEKYNGPALRYEIGICIQTGWIVWVNGPFPGGSWPDQRIAKEFLFHNLQNGEEVLADRGYSGHFVHKPGQHWQIPGMERQKATVRARHEVINS
eukprot:scaffold697_cov104-Amphora_coffeaeformis.AAC.2